MTRVAIAHLVADLPTQYPSWIEWFSRLGPLATVLTAVVALAVGVRTVRQRTEADRRDQWWKRAQWALDLALEPDADKQLVGFQVLRYLARSKLATFEELELLDAVAVPSFAEPANEIDVDEDVEENDVE